MVFIRLSLRSDFVIPAFEGMTKQIMKIINTKSAEETRAFAEKFAGEFLEGGVIALSGDLGAGKTTFAQGFAQGLGVTHRIVSPTFLIIRQYPIPDKKSFFYHIDLYRMENINLKDSGLEEILSEPSNIVLIEWAEKLGVGLPQHSHKISLRKINELEHEINI